MSGAWGYVAIFVAGFLATDVWRLLGVLSSARLDETSPVLQWVRAVSTALVAGLVTKLVIFAPGALGEVPLWMRLVAPAAGVAAYFAARRSVFAGVVASEVVLVGALLLRG